MGPTATESSCEPGGIEEDLISLAYQVAPKPPPNASLGRVEKWHSDFQAKLELPRVLSKQWKLDNLLQSTEDGRRSWTYSLQIGV